ncbi:MAG: hypothetical protein EBT09_09905, partial [Actinobacteria bacterium]|nr:hypothetical protein [Actinomycetota bacterium]
MLMSRSLLLNAQDTEPTRLRRLKEQAAAALRSTRGAKLQVEHPTVETLSDFLGPLRVLVAAECYPAEVLLFHQVLDKMPQEIAKDLRDFDGIGDSLTSLHIKLCYGTDFAALFENEERPFPQMDVVQIRGEHVDMLVREIDASNERTRADVYITFDARDTESRSEGTMSMFFSLELNDKRDAGFRW